MIRAKSKNAAIRRIVRDETSKNKIILMSGVTGSTLVSLEEMPIKVLVIGGGGRGMR